MKDCNRKRRAFTLAELVLSLALLGIVFVLITSIVCKATNSWNFVTRKCNQSERVYFVLEKIALELESAEGWPDMTIVAKQNQICFIEKDAIRKTYSITTQKELVLEEAGVVSILLSNCDQLLLDKYVLYLQATDGRLFQKKLTQIPSI